MKITISQYSFTLREPYSKGFIITGLEAQALNRLRAENIRNNMAKVWKKRFSLRSQPTQEDLESFQAQIKEYDLGYSFRDSLNEFDSNNTIEVEIEKIAREELEDEIRMNGLELTRFEYDQLILAKRSSQETLAKAQKKVYTRQVLAAKAMEELIGGGAG